MLLWKLAVPAAFLAGFLGDRLLRWTTKRVTFRRKPKRIPTTRFLSELRSRLQEWPEVDDETLIDWVNDAQREIAEKIGEPIQTTRFRSEGLFDSRPLTIDEKKAVRELVEARERIEGEIRSYLDSHTPFSMHWRER